MLKKHHQFISGLFVLGDLIGVVILWAFSYCVVFDLDLNPLAVLLNLDHLDEEVSSLWIDYRNRLPVGLVLAFFSFHLNHFYRPRRSESIWIELPDLIKGCLLWAVLLSVYGYWETPPKQSIPLFSRYFVFLLASGQLLWVTAVHLIGRSVLRKLRRRGYNLRHVLIVGAGPLGQQVLEKIHSNRWTGLRAVGFLDEDKDLMGREINGVNVLGVCEDVNKVISEKGVDQVYVALPRQSQQRLHDLMQALSIETVDVKVIPDLTDFVTLRMSIGDLDGLPLINLQETPLVGWNRVIKRIFDLMVGFICMIVFLFPMVLIALLVKVTSKGPIFYKQERMGLDGRSFYIYKFRSMKVDAERETGAVWAKENDDRRTILGSFLRASNLDELPQLINVLKGEMSLVGPRPERPVFINEFKNKIPRYMLRHKMKSGMTGWAQVNGWRGNTSLEKRIQYDLYYIENWSLLFDIRIMFMQLFKWRSKNAY